MSEERSSPAVADLDRHQKAIHAILTSSESVTRSTLYTLYTQEASEALQSRIYELVTGISESVESDEENSLPSPTKRMREESQTPEEEGSPAKKPRWLSILFEPVSCLRCQELFNIDDEAKGCCRHPGTMKLNHASYAWQREAHIDPSEFSSKELDTAFYREYYANGFEWTCCGQPGGRPGCKWRRHKASESDSDNSGDSDESDESEGSDGSDESDDGDEGDQGDEW